MPEAVAVWKFDLWPTVQGIPMPSGARLLYATVQFEAPVIYFLVRPENPRTMRRVRVVATGEPFEVGDAESAGLLTMGQGSLMFHVFVWPD